MNTRFAILILLLFAGAYAGGWYGLCAAVIFGVIPLGILFPYHPKAEEYEAASEDAWEKVEHARRGSEVDPTRPRDEHPLLLTREVRRNR